MHNVGDKVIISDTWLKACGMLAYSGKPWTVVRVQPMIGDERMYHVEADDGRTWSVWSIRGVTKA